MREPGSEMAKRLVIKVKLIILLGTVQCQESAIWQPNVLRSMSHLWFWTHVGKLNIKSGSTLLHLYEQIHLFLPISLQCTSIKENNPKGKCIITFLMGYLLSTNDDWKLPQK